MEGGEGIDGESGGTATGKSMYDTNLVTNTNA